MSGDKEIMIREKRNQRAKHNAYKAMSQKEPSAHAKMFANFSPLPKPTFGHWVSAADTRKPEDTSCVYVQFSGKSDIETFEHEQSSAVYFADEGFLVNWPVELLECEVEAWMPLARTYGV